MSAVLVAYASKGGSTKEVAEAVAQTLCECGLEVTLQAVNEVQSLEGYSAVVIGAPIISTFWHADARQFLMRHRAALDTRNVAIFALGPVTTGDTADFKRSRSQFDMSLRAFPWFKPVSVEMFGGKMAATDSGFLLNRIFKPTPAVDFRDWNAIKAWAQGLADKL